MENFFKVLKNKLHPAFFTIRGRILLITVTFMLLFGNLAAFVSYRYTTASLSQSLIQTSETKISFLSASINDNISNVKVFLRSCQTNNDVYSFVSGGSSPAQKKVNAAETISELYRSNSALQSQIVRMVILNPSENNIVQIVEPVYSSSAVSYDAVVNLPYFDSLHNQSSQCTTGILTDEFLLPAQVPMLPFVYSIQNRYNARESGCIFVEISTSIITQPIQNYQAQEDSAIFFTLDDYTYQYNPQDVSLTLCTEEYEQIKNLSDKVISPDTNVWIVKRKSDNRQYISITRPLSPNGWYISEYIGSSFLSHTVRKVFTTVMVLIIAAVILLGFVLYLFLSRTIAAPVRKILNSMERIKNGDFSRDVSIEWDHEFGEIGRTVNDLAENVLTLMSQKMEDEKEKRDYEYRMLQSQINPHFLYNTLNSIKWMATISGASGISEMTTALSRLLKDISKGTSTLVTIEHELSFIHDYFTIQQYRYGGTITLTVNVDDEALLKSQILRFSLQPIVENAIFHGIEPKGAAGNITIRLYAEAETDVRIDITDDGVGMEPEVCAGLLEDDSRKNSSSFFREIGIANVHKRLQYEFGEKYGLSIDSEKGKFTTVSVLLPYHPEMNDAPTRSEL